MKKLLNIFILFILFSCTTKRVDPSFENDFKKAINSIQIIANMSDSDAFADTLLVNFYFSQSYLNHVTGVFANVQYLDEIPYYPNKKMFEKDLEKWMNWYENNKFAISKKSSDSIKNVVWNTKVWW